ncbi:MAG: CRISPR-associated endonuclease Cas1 [Planctomycetes bacterium]|nr:CRISPR-associated endonuclease Cas1 [Planctomycetota bacterium]
MRHRPSSFAAPIAHLIGPGKIKILNGRLAFSTGSATPLRLDLESLQAIVCYGPVGVTDDALRLLLTHDVHVSWLTADGQRCRGRLIRDRPDQVALRVRQHRVLQVPAAKLELARAAVMGKIESQQAAARHYQRQGRYSCGPMLHRLEDFRAAAEACGDMNTLRGIEGSASCLWFEALRHLLQPPWLFDKRVRRPPTDPVNALLSLGYTWLAARVTAACEARGLETTLGALHDNRPGRPALALDLMEPLRVPAVDRWTLSLCISRRVTPEEFIAGEDGGVRLVPQTFPRILADWETHWVQGHLQNELDAIINGLESALRAWDQGSSA